MKYLTIKNFIARLKSESPKFFKRLRIYAVALGALGPILIAFKEKYPLDLAFLPNQLSGYLITAGLVGTFLTSLTVKDTDKEGVK